MAIVFAVSLATETAAAQSVSQPRHSAFMSERSKLTRKKSEMQSRGSMVHEQPKAPQARAASQVGLLDSIIYMTNDGAYATLEKYSYDANGYQTLIESFEWFSSEYGWEKMSESSFKNDDNGNVLLVESYWWDGDNNWIMQAKDVYAYDAAGNETLYEYYVLNGATSELVGLWKWTYKYNAAGNMTLSESHNWNPTEKDWNKPSYSHSFTYDAAGKLMLVEDSEWDSGMSKWVKYNKSDLKYDTKGYLISEEISKWDDGISDWKRSYKYSYTNNAAGNPTLYECFLWNDGIGAFGEEALEKMIYAYDAAGNETLYEYYVLDDATSELEGVNRLICAYNSAGYLKSEESFYWEGAISDWMSESTQTYYYNGIIAVEEVLADNAAGVRCWVSGGMLTVIPAYNEVVTVYTSTGSMVASVAAQGGEAVEIALPARGVYIIKTTAGVAKVVW